MSKYLAESYDKALRENYALRQENERLVAANKARDEFLRGHRYKRSEMDGYIGLCESQMDALKARLAEAERDAARYRWLRDEQFQRGRFPMAAVVWKANFDRQSSDWVNSVDAASIDAHIDAAMAAETVSPAEGE